MQFNFPGLFSARSNDNGHLFGLQAFLALHDTELDLLSFLQGLVAISDDLTKVDEHIILACSTLDETKALGVVEPLHRSRFAICHTVKPSESDVAAVLKS